jgi:uncharacterized protein
MVVFKVAMVALLIYAALCLWLYLAQDRLLYPGAGESVHPEARDLRLNCGDATVKVWEMHPQAQAALLYFGGNGEDVGSNLSSFDGAFPDRALYLVNYRGYGGSTGSPSERALISDARTIYDWVAARHSRIAVMGRSLGTGVATALATLRPVERVVLVTPYDSIVSIAAERYSWFPVRWLIKDPYDSAGRMGKVRAPVLVLIAGQDESIPRAHSDALVAAIPGGMGRVVVIPGATHNDVETFPVYLGSVREFLAGSAGSRCGLR